MSSPFDNNSMRRIARAVRKFEQPIRRTIAKIHHRPLQAEGPNNGLAFQLSGGFIAGWPGWYKATALEGLMTNLDFTGLTEGPEIYVVNYPEVNSTLVAMSPIGGVGFIYGYYEPTGSEVAMGSGTDPGLVPGTPLVIGVTFRYGPYQCPPIIGSGSGSGG